MSVELLNQIKDFQLAQKESLGSIKQRIDRIEARYNAPDAGQNGSGAGGLFGNYKTPGARLIEQKDALDMFRKTGRIRFEIGAMFPQFEEKTLIDSAALGFSTPGILNAERIEGFVPLPRRRLTVRNLLRTRRVEAAQVDWIRESVFTNSASPQTEASAKSESADTFTIATDKVHTIAHWLPCSVQVLDDLPGLREFVDAVLIYGLLLREEQEVLSGDALGDHYNGLITQATTYAGTYAAASDTKLDKLRHAILELEDHDEQATGFVLNPRDAHDIDLIKDEVGGANTGKYVVGDPLGGILRVRTLWGRPVVETNNGSPQEFVKTFKYR